MSDEGVNIREESGVQIVEFDDRMFDRLTVEHAARQLDMLVARLDKPYVLISFRNVQEISSAVLGAIIALHKEVKSRGGQLRLADMSPNIDVVFRTMNLDRLLMIHPDSEEAMQAFSLPQGGQA